MPPASQAEQRRTVEVADQFHFKLAARARSVPGRPQFSMSAASLAPRVRQWLLVARES